MATATWPGRWLRTMSCGVSLDARRALGQRMGDARASTGMVGGIRTFPSTRCTWASPPRTSAERYKISRQMMDQALASQPRRRRHRRGLLHRADRPVEIATARAPMPFQEDDPRRAATTLDVPSKPAFKKEGGTVTAGNASGTTTALPLWCWPRRRGRPGPRLRPLAWLVLYAHAGVGPGHTWGYWPRARPRRRCCKRRPEGRRTWMIEANQALRRPGLRGAMANSA